MPKRFQVGPLGEHDDEWLTAWAALTGRSKSDQATMVLAFRIRDRKQSIQELLEHSAKRRGMEPDELFDLLIRNPKWLKENPIDGEEDDDSTPELE